MVLSANYFPFIWGMVLLILTLKTNETGMARADTKKVPYPGHPSLASKEAKNEQNMLIQKCLYWDKCISKKDKVSSL